MPLTQADPIFKVLRASAAELADTVESISPDDLRRQAYPTEWNIADVLSHLGSGAVISRLRIDGEVDTQAIWDEWNSKTPDDQASDALDADRELLERLDSLDAGERADFHVDMGPVALDFAASLEMRLNEHAVHSWDIAITLDETATMLPEAVDLVVDNLGLIARFAAKPTTGVNRTITIRTTSPVRHFEIALQSDHVDFSSTNPAGEPNLEVPAEALIRLIYGRLDPRHTPAIEDPTGLLDLLRTVFAGV